VTDVCKYCVKWALWTEMQFDKVTSNQIVLK
jgi:hypothetical protein